MQLNLSSDNQWQSACLPTQASSSLFLVSPSALSLGTITMVMRQTLCTLSLTVIQTLRDSIITPAQGGQGNLCNFYFFTILFFFHNDRSIYMAHYHWYKHRVAIILNFVIEDICSLSFVSVLLCATIYHYIVCFRRIFDDEIAYSLTTSINFRASIPLPALNTALFVSMPINFFNFHRPTPPPAVTTTTASSGSVIDGPTRSPLSGKGRSFPVTSLDAVKEEESQRSAIYSGNCPIFPNP